MQRLIDAFYSMRSQLGGDKLVKQVETAAQLVQSINALGNAMGVNFSTVKDMFAWVGPVLAALNGNAICDANPRAAIPASSFRNWSPRVTTDASTRSILWPGSYRGSETDRPSTQR